MSIANIFYLLIIRPLELLFEVIFYLADSVIGNPGLAIIVLSIAVNLLVLPLYIRADRLQKDERDIEEKLDRWVRHIKKTFRGDERFMMLQAYYRENHYKPAYVLKGVLPLMLQVPFFIAAYRFLSGLKILQGASFGPISDLGAPDGLIGIFGIGINVLPVLMTLINVFSSAVYTRGASARAKIQVYGTALIFLFLLYRAPSGLAFYWTLNNLFSLIKNLIYKLKDLVVAWVSRSRHEKGNENGQDNKLITVKASTGSSAAIYVLAVLYIVLFIGALIPSAVTSSSATEFVDSLYLNNPMNYILYSLCISFGVFAVWIGVYYGLSRQTKKGVFTCIMWMCSVMFTVNYLFFGTQFGNMSSNLQYDVKPCYGTRDIIINLAVMLLVMAATYILYKKAPRFVVTILVSMIVVCICLTLNNTKEVLDDYDHMRSVTKDYNEEASIHLSKDGKNVVVIMMDRMIGYYIPYIMEENKSLYESFDGFTYYPNTVSFGTSTNAGLPPLMGGYEYTPEEMNKRDSELLADKHNEALKVMPVLYKNNGFDVTVIDPTYVNYDNFTNLSIFDEYPEIHKYSMEGAVRASKKTEGNNLNRNFFFYGLFRAVPAFLQSTIYDDGNYNALERVGELSSDSIQIYGEDMKTADGINVDCKVTSEVLESLVDITEIEDGGNGSLTIMNNNLTHSAGMLQLPDYTQPEHIDNEMFGDDQFVKYDKNGEKLELTDLEKLAHYHVNMATMNKLGKWMDYLREQGVYDNTRIIITSDHAFGLNLRGDLLIDGADVNGGDGPMDCLWYNCALLVKDYNAKGFTTDDTFMTNADVPTLATRDLIEDPVNPFTGKKIDNSYKNENELKLMVTVVWRVKDNNGEKFVSAPYYTVKENIFNRDNWKYLGNY